MCTMAPKLSSTCIDPTKMIPSIIITSKIAPASPNPRTFEIAASTTLQLTDARDDIARFYKPGVEIETYSLAAGVTRQSGILSYS